MKRETAKWVRKAEAGFVGARELALAKRPLHDLICFHCQQSAEKYLKAMLQEAGVRVPRIHNLRNLLLLLLPHDGSLKVIRRPLLPLTRFAVAFRYPGKNATRRQSQAALKQVERVRNEIRARLGLPP
jgi:HEPN domain-containing protein